MGERPPTRIAALMTSFNRRDATLACLEALFAQQGLDSEFSLSVFLVDAGSPDGTAEAVAARFPTVVVQSATPATYWGGGMRMASQAARRGEADFDLWLNDDVLLHPAAVRVLLDAARAMPASQCLVVGQLVDAHGKPSYGGFVRAGSPLGFRHLGVREDLAPCDTFNGNVVLVPRAVTVQLDSIDPAFPHGMGDIDFGLRAKQAGYRSVQAPGVVGTCEGHAPTGRAAGARARLREVSGIKRLPPRAWWTFCRRYAGAWAPIMFAKPYLDALR